MDDAQSSTENIHQQLQRIIVDLLENPVSDQPAAVREELETRISAAGLTLPPDKWLADTSVDVAAGNLVLLDAKLGWNAENADDDRPVD